MTVPRFAYIGEIPHRDRWRSINAAAQFGGAVMLAAALASEISPRVNQEPAAILLTMPPGQEHTNAAVAASSGIKEPACEHRVWELIKAGLLRRPEPVVRDANRDSVRAMRYIVTQVTL